MLYKTVWCVLILTSLAVTGCAFPQTVTYKLDDITPTEIDLLSHSILNIESFEDLRRTVPENKMFFSEGRETRAPGRLSCINSEKHYEETPVPVQIANIMAQHLNKRGAFKLVTVNQKENADLYLTGKLKRFAGVQDFSKSAAVLSGIGGILSALAAMGLKTDGSIDIEFGDLAVYRKDGTLLTNLDNIRETFVEQLKADAYCWKIYKNVNEKLKLVVDKLGDEMEKRIAGAEFKVR